MDDEQAPNVGSLLIDIFMQQDSEGRRIMAECFAPDTPQRRLAETSYRSVENG